MKITQTITMASALLLAAGCAHEERSVRTDESASPSYGYSYAGSKYSGRGTYSGTPTTENGAFSSNASASQSDNTIVAQVREDLRRDPEIAVIVPNIQISANNGAIILSGSVQSEQQKRQILSRVQKVTGVVTVNNQLTVISGANGQQNPQLNPTGANSGNDRLYKDAANGADHSTNNALNPTSRENGPSQLYRESNQGPSGQQPNDSLNATSRTNGQSQIYQGNPGEKPQDQNSNTNNNRQMP
jgi:hypothetical protein